MNMHVINLNKFSIAAIYLVVIGVLTLLLDTHSLKKETTDNTFLQEKVSSVAPNELNLMTNWSFFGTANTSLEKVKSTNLQLIGIIFEGADSLAIIRIDGKEEILKNGSKINSIYTINKIEPLRVIVATGEGLEQLELFESKGVKNNIQNPGQGAELIDEQQQQPE